jgi:hypothetical protein
MQSQVAVRNVDLLGCGNRLRASKPSGDNKSPGKNPSKNAGKNPGKSPNPASHGVRLYITKSRPTIKLSRRAVVA